MSRPRGTPRRDDDGILDDVAVDRVVTGDVTPLTDAERVEVSRRLDGSIDKTQVVLRCGRGVAVQVAREARQSLPAKTKPIPNPPSWWVPFAEVVTVYDNRETGLPLRYKPREPKTPTVRRLPDEPEPCECCGLVWGCGKQWAARNGISPAQLRRLDQSIANRMASPLSGGINGVDLIIGRRHARGDTRPDATVVELAKLRGGETLAA